MKTGKLPPDALRRAVLTHGGRPRPEVLVGPAVGEDSAILDLGNDLCVVTMDPITGSSREIGWLAVHIACNDLAANGAEPLGVLLTLLLPEGSGEAEVEALMLEADRASREIGVQILGGHTEITPDLSKTIVCTAAIGTVPRQRLVTSAGARPGDELVMTKGAGIEGTAILAWDYGAVLVPSVGEEVVRSARAMSAEISVVPEARVAASYQPTAMHDVTEGGVLGALYELASASSVGLRIRRAAIPVRPATARICDFFSADPLRLISSGTLLVAVPRGNALSLVDNLAQQGISAGVIGAVVDPQSGLRLVEEDGQSVEIEPPESDELWRIKGIWGQPSSETSPE